MNYPEVKRHVVIYQDDLYYSAMPSVITLSSGEIITAFRRAPERRNWGRRNVSHCDPNSQLVFVRSDDNGNSWSLEPELIYSHPLGGCQDPCLFKLRNESIICSSYGWCLTGSHFNPEAKSQHLHIGPYYFLGGLLLKSEDRCKSWQMTPPPPRLEGNVALDIFAKKYRAFNRGSMAVDASGLLLWSVTSHKSIKTPNGKIELLTSEDNGNSWQHRSTIAESDKSFNESSLYVTPKGDIICFIRSFGMGDQTIVARSGDGGQNFEKWQDAGFKGHPHHAIRLNDNRALLVYGYRHKPFGIRGRILDPECENISESEEIIIRDDGTNADIGYPWAAKMPDGNILVTYYYNDNDGTRYIAGTILG